MRYEARLLDAGCDLPRRANLASSAKQTQPPGEKSVTARLTAKGRQPVGGSTPPKNCRHTADHAQSSPRPANGATVNDIVETWHALDGTLLEMRPMRPSDGPQVKVSLNKLSADARCSRFFASIAEFSDDAVHRLIDIDPAREYLLVVLRRDDNGEIPIAGGRFVLEDQRPECAFSLLIGDPWQGQGIGRRIIKALIREASRRGMRRMHGHVLADNRPMLALARALHFAVRESDQGDDVLEVVRELPVGKSPRWTAFCRKFWRRRGNQR